MSIIAVKLTYDSQSRVPKLEPEPFQALFGEIIATKDWKPGGSSWNYSDTLIVTSAELETLTDAGFPTEIVRYKNTYQPMKGHIPDPEASTIHYHLPGLGLLAINEVVNLDNACTDELQRHLDDGWRVLAVCPPNGTRRPDYILGRTKGA